MTPGPAKAGVEISGQNKERKRSKKKEMGKA
jgi:hypothetical protein